ncbi:transcription factor Pcc1-domain-containing protein [Coprinopsis sp. MPI-PUGE-AT-0042]|nr:transcription factor Pcc1-domain-containing protein [Coprinopsis sp. MPI-PUGE-AT-0042]
MASDTKTPGSSSDWHYVTIAVPFLTEKHASIAKQVIEVDAELQPLAVKRTLSVEGNQLKATFQTLTVRLARLTVNAFLENVDLVVRTIEHFGDDADKKPISYS